MVETQTHLLFILRQKQCRSNSETSNSNLGRKQLGFEKWKYTVTFFANTMKKMILHSFKNPLLAAHLLYFLYRETSFLPLCYIQDDTFLSSVVQMPGTTPMKIVSHLSDPGGCSRPKKRAIITRNHRLTNVQCRGLSRDLKIIFRMGTRDSKLGSTPLRWRA